MFGCEFSRFVVEVFVVVAAAELVLCVLHLYSHFDEIQFERIKFNSKNVDESVGPRVIVFPTKAILFSIQPRRISPNDVSLQICILLRLVSI